LDLVKDDDKASISTGADAESLQNASTRAVFAAPGVLSRERKATNASNLSASLAPGYDSAIVDGMKSEVASTMRPDTPLSNLSNERLQSHQDVDPNLLRSASAVAILKAPGVVGVVDGMGSETPPGGGNPEEQGAEALDNTEAAKIDEDLDAKVREQHAEDRATEKPDLYGKTETEFKPAMEVL
jgi:hypothetical protein